MSYILHEPLRWEILALRLCGVSMMVLQPTSINFKVYATLTHTVNIKDNVGGRTDWLKWSVVHACYGRFVAGIRERVSQRPDFCFIFGRQNGIITAMNDVYLGWGLEGTPTNFVCTILWVNSIPGSIINCWRCYLQGRIWMVASQFWLPYWVSGSER